MDEVTEGIRQRREANAYNLFYSAVTARATPSLYNHGVRIPMLFPEIEDRTSDITAEPDFVLYDGETCILAEIKSGHNIEGRHIKQMRECDGVDIETAEAALKDAQVQDRMGYTGTVTAVEPVIIYQDLDEAYIEEAETESTQFRDRLEELTSYAVLMTQDYGDQLRPLRGEFNESGNLQSLLRRGVELPQNPPDQIMLTEGMEHEILAIAIADVWGEKALDYADGLEVSRTEVRDYFSPQHNVRLTDLDLVFDFLVEIGACEQVENHTYQFTRNRFDAVLDVEPQVLSEPVEDYLHGTEQMSLTDNFENN
ncbi:hypothetical protein [Haloarcula argentinensis]|uniref:Restriction endonuclease n=1 Tax=Haloarcula argentinensis TaxID=43776 RepID=A0A830FWA7_HALAR|nr:hypothetical protein [Haloarcula argentinensis]GGM50658.1 hypothetical protein GCM10009006_34780 [Haloarcula argentinensis]